MRTLSEYLNGTESEQLSIMDRYKREAEKVAYHTGRYVEINGRITYNKRFVDAYVKMCIELE